MKNTPSSRPASSKVRTDDYSDNGKPDTVEQLTSEIYVLAAEDKPRQTPIDPSSVTFTGGLYDLWRTLDKIDHGDDWDGLRVAENAKANDEAVVHKNNGRVRLFPKTKTTKANCVAVLMDSYDFRQMSRHICHYIDHQTAFNKICDEKDGIVKQNKNLKLDIRDREKELERLQASDPTAAATLRCRREVDELRVRLFGAEDRISALKTLQQVEQLEITAWRQFTTESLIEILEEANLMPPCKGDPEQSKHNYLKEGWPSPTITSPTAPNPFVTSPSATSPSVTSPFTTQSYCYHCRRCQHDRIISQNLNPDTRSSVDFPPLPTRHPDGGRPSRRPRRNPDEDTAGEDDEGSGDQKSDGESSDWGRPSDEHLFFTDDGDRPGYEEGPDREPGCAHWRGLAKR